MDNRRDFIKKASLLGGGVGLWSALPASIKKALEINPAVGSTFYDAEHIVLLMQENRSFDHCFGTLQGVRGYNDPRAVHLPNQNKVWLQSDKDGNTYAPFRLDIKNTRSTWTGNLPHNWDNQTDARNRGRFDQWLEAKRSGYKEYAHMPLTLGFYNREDIPFYYAMADAFTVCDQHFCSSLTGTTPNRLFFFTGKLRGGKNNQANVDNENVDYNKEVDWETFPQRLEDNGISWKIYQNEISLDSGLEDEEDFWLGNFTDNPLEWFKQHSVRFSKAHYLHCKKLAETLPDEITALENKLPSLSGDEADKATKALQRKKRQLEYAQHDAENYSPEKFAALSQYEKNLHDKAFTTNGQDVDYHTLETFTYEDDGAQKEMKAPKGDVFYQFRKDVQDNKLPTVSWLVAPQAFSDHPSSPWYGAWYVSEALDILTQNPDIWKKTIFILTYDENDGYFDHVPPFVAPKPGDADSGAVSPGIETKGDYVTLEEDILRVGENNKLYARESPVGLGYRVPMIIASPWTRGGWVNSEVFDHTSYIQFLEKFLQKKTKKNIREENISSWRRTVSGDLTSVFKQYNGEKITLPFVDRNSFLASIQMAKNKQLPDGWHLMSKKDIQQINENPISSPYMPQQEKGIRDACALPYELYVNASLADNKKTLRTNFIAGNEIFGEASAGAAFNVYVAGKYLQKNEQGESVFVPFKVWNFTTAAGQQLAYEFPIDHFENGLYHLRVHGPNGFYRELKGNAQQAGIEVQCNYQRSGEKKLSGNIELVIENNTHDTQEIMVVDNAYKNPKVVKTLMPLSRTKIIVPTADSFGWYDCSVLLKNNRLYERKFAGRVETGKHTKTDPLMGNLI